jgi:hypothetical protein
MNFLKKILNYGLNLLRRILKIKSPSEAIFQPKLFKVPKPSLNIYEYLKAIKLAHDTGNKKLNVEHHGWYATWNPDEDTGWIAYSKARYMIARCKIIDLFLQKINYI